MSVPRSLEGFDVIGAVARMLDQPLLWWQAIGLFVEHFAGWEKAWQDCIGDDVQERRKVHALRSAAASVGALQLAEAAGYLEDLLLKRLAGEVSAFPASSRQQLQRCYRQAWQAAETAWEAQRPPEGRA